MTKDSMTPVQPKKIIKIKKTYRYVCEVCEGDRFLHKKFYCPDCEQIMCPCCTGQFMKARDGEFEGQTICQTCYVHSH